MSDALFTLTTDAHRSGELLVVSLEGTEELSEPYRFRIAINVSDSLNDVEQAERDLLGQAASLVVRHGEEPARCTHGIISRVEVAEAAVARSSSNTQTGHLMVDLVPRLSLLALRTNCRIFQNKSVVAIALDIFKEWSVAARADLKTEPVARTYCTQYNETDLEFVQRILAEDGISFFFDASMEASGVGLETVVLVDGPWFCPTVPAANDQEVALRYRHADHPGLKPIVRLSASRQLRPRVVTLADFDHRNPNLAMRQSAEMKELPSKPPSPEDGLRAFLYRDRAERAAGESGLTDGKALKTLERLRSDAEVFAGEGHSRRFLVGHILHVAGHPNESLNGRLLVRRLVHHGQVPEHGVDAPANEATYRCAFEAWPATFPFKPSLRSRKVRNSVETATVVGPVGEEIHCDELGRVKVQFHWDQAGQRDEQSSCWIRVSQTWAGAGWGTQYIPRVGTEVVVAFLGGDPDRPLITGSVYNATHPLPFELPDEAGKSGIRTSSLGAEGHNELSFDDRAGKEQIYLRAERNWQAEVKGDHALHISGSHDVHVEQQGKQNYLKGLTATVGGELKQRIAGDYDLSVTGASAQSFDGSSELRVQGSLTQAIAGAAHYRYSSSIDTDVSEDLAAKMKGHVVAVVGEHDARKSLAVHVEGLLSAYASGAHELSSDKRLVLSCGESRLVLTPDSIEISANHLRLGGEQMEFRSQQSVAIEAPEKISLKAPTIVAESEEAFLGLAKIAKLNGKKVKLNCENDPVDELEPEASTPATVIELSDKDGKPMAKRRFRLLLPDGSEVTGCTNDEGRAELRVEASGEIEFLDVDDPQEK